MVIHVNGGPSYAMEVPTGYGFSVHFYLDLSVHIKAMWSASGLAVLPSLAPEEAKGPLLHLGDRGTSGRIRTVDFPHERLIH